MYLAAGLTPLETVVTIMIKPYLGPSLCGRERLSKVVQGLVVIPGFMVLKTGVTMALPQTLNDKQLKETFDRNIYYYKLLLHLRQMLPYLKSSKVTKWTLRSHET
jgi:hypothetical protein